MRPPPNHITTVSAVAAAPRQWLPCQLMVAEIGIQRCRAIGSSSTRSPVVFRTRAAHCLQQRVPVFLDPYG